MVTANVIPAQTAVARPLALQARRSGAQLLGVAERGM